MKGGYEMNDTIALLIVVVVGVVVMTVFAMFAIKLMVDTARSSKSNDDK